MRVLILDDHEGIILLLKKILHANGHEVAAFTNGADALEHLLDENNSIDFIIADFHMPVFDGLEFCQEVKSMDRYAKTPFIFISSEQSDLVKKKARDLGAVSFMAKPFDERALIALMDALIVNS